MTQPPSGARFRWLVLAVFVLSTAINYLDRATLATLAPVVKAEFHLSNAEYGWIVSAFMLTYALSAPLAGMLIDRIGLNRAISLAVGVWSCAGIATGFTTRTWRAWWDAARARTRGSGGIPAAGKAIHQYLRPAERALGNAVNQAGVSLGLVLAPPLATCIAVRSGWRHAFVVTGLLGLAWIPLWIWVSRRVPAAAAPKAPLNAGAGLLRDRRLWAFVLANALSMIGYSLWTNWTTLYLVDVQHMTMSQAAWYAWIPPVLAAAGGFAGGWLSLRWMNFGMPARDGALPRLPAGVGACAGRRRDSGRARPGVGLHRNLAQHLRRGSLQRQYVQPSARYLRRRARGLRGLHAGRFRRGRRPDLAVLRTRSSICTAMAP